MVNYALKVLKPNITKILALTMLLFAAITAVTAQRKSESIDIFFEQSKHQIKPGFEQNEERMQVFADTVQYLIDNASFRVHRIIVISNTSPEGDFNFNQELSNNRNTAARQYLLEHTVINDTVVEIDSRTIDWDHLAYLIENDPAYRGNKDAVLEIITQSPDTSLTERDFTHQRIAQLKQANNGISWAYMHEYLFPEMRNAKITIIFEKADEFIEVPPVRSLIPAQAHTPTQVSPIAPIQPLREPAGSLYVKTNVLALAASQLNAAVEYCFVGDRFSVNLPVYYSAIDYFSKDLKFRTFALYPEFRYWIPGTGADGTRGLYVGAHFGMAYYNYAFDGELRYQDHNGKSPALGGGLGLGYRLPLTKDRKWNIEFSVGAGVYSLYYDTFYNVPNGKLTGTYKDTYWGLDNAGISISYRFDLTKKRK